jgi:hypothetical protein
VKLLVWFFRESKAGIFLLKMLTGISAAEDYQSRVAIPMSQLLFLFDLQTSSHIGGAANRLKDNVLKPRPVHYHSKNRKYFLHKMKISKNVG